MKQMIKSVKDYSILEVEFQSDIFSEEFNQVWMANDFLYERILGWPEDNNSDTVFLVVEDDKVQEAKEELIKIGAVEIERLAVESDQYWDGNKIWYISTESDMFLLSDKDKYLVRIQVDQENNSEKFWQAEKWNEKFDEYCKKYESDDSDYFFCPYSEAQNIAEEMRLSDGWNDINAPDFAPHPVLFYVSEGAEPIEE